MMTNIKNLFNCLNRQEKAYKMSCLSEGELKSGSHRAKVADANLQMHSFHIVSGCSTKLAVKEYARAEASKTVNAIYRLEKRNTEWKKMSEYVACCYDRRWWLAYVLKTMQESDEVKVCFLQSHRPA